MNDQTVRLLTYRNADVAKLVTLLSQTKVNLLVIGRHNSWVINARAIAKNNFIGTKCAVGLTNKACERKMWYRLRNFALKYAASGSVVNIFCLNLISNGSARVSQCEKIKHSFA